VTTDHSASPSPDRSTWLNRTVWAIVLATFCSDFGHEMATAVLPLYLASVGLGPAALGLIEGTADLLVSLAKLAGGFVGHVVTRKRGWAALGYLATALGTGGIALASNLAAVLGLRAAAWTGRGFRSPLRDFLLADSVPSRFYGRAFGLERAGDMLGAVAGPLVAAVLLGAGADFRTVILASAVPGLIATAAFYVFTQDRPTQNPVVHSESTAAPPRRPTFPRGYWLFLVGVVLFGLGDFSRTFLVWLAAHALGEDGPPASGIVSVAVLLYAIHNLVSAAAAYPLGLLGDRRPKLSILIAGYSLGIATHLLLAFFSGTLAGLLPAILLSAITLAAEETLEKAVAAEMLPRELRSLGFGILACGNAIGDMVSSVTVGLLLEAGHTRAAFGFAAAMATLGVLWLLVCFGPTGRPSRAAHPSAQTDAP
jgi:MFS family permease